VSAALLSGAASPVYAQTAAAAATNRVDELLQRGLDLRHEQRDADALVLFQQALELDCAGTSAASAGQNAQTVALVSGGVALAFAAGALWTGFTVGSSSSEQAGLESCSIGWAGALCSGHF
jgi:hypothetical protein